MSMYFCTSSTQSASNVSYILRVIEKHKCSWLLYFDAWTLPGVLTMESELEVPKESQASRQAQIGKQTPPRVHRARRTLVSST